MITAKYTNFLILRMRKTEIPIEIEIVKLHKTSLKFQFIAFYYACFSIHLIPFIFSEQLKAIYFNFFLTTCDFYCERTRYDRKGNLTELSTFFFHPFVAVVYFLKTREIQFKFYILKNCRFNDNLLTFLSFFT